MSSILFSNIFVERVLIFAFHIKVVFSLIYFEGGWSREEKEREIEEKEILFDSPLPGNHSSLRLVLKLGVRN